MGISQKMTQIVFVRTSSTAVYISAFVDTHGAYPRRDGQAELPTLYF